MSNAISNEELKAMIEFLREWGRRYPVAPEEKYGPDQNVALLEELLERRSVEALCRCGHKRSDHDVYGCVFEKHDGDEGRCGAFTLPDAKAASNAKVEFARRWGLDVTVVDQWAGGEVRSPEHDAIGEGVCNGSTLTAAGEESAR